MTILPFERKMEFLLSAVTIVCLFVHTAICAPLTDSNVTDLAELNGKVLMKLGAKLKLPKLHLIGRTIDNMAETIENKIKETIEEKIEEKIEETICELNPCTLWTDWKGCVAKSGQFGSKFRTRQCGVNTTTRETDADSRTETEFGICINTCPKDYNVTKNGFCLKLYADQSRTWDDAEQECRKDGGHLVNIDSERKYEDVNNMLQVHGFGASVWINGRKKHVDSPWEFTYGSQGGFFKWGPGSPQNKSTELCLDMYHRSGEYVMHDYKCSGGLYPICEILAII